jgi:Protein of unknown function (DUF1552)
MNAWEIRRRSVLKALGVGMGCLPLLQSSRGSAAATRPQRLLIVAATEGYRQALWRPMDGSLMNQTLPDSSSPLEPHKADLIFLPGMTHPSFTGGAHGAFPNHLSTSNSGVKEYRVPTSATFDQVVGPPLAMKDNLPMPTLNLGLLSDKGIMGEGANSRYCFAKGKDQIIVPEQDPWKTYARIFAGAGGTPTTMGPDPAVTKTLTQRKSILDYVGKDLEKFAIRVGKDDGAIVGGHLAAVRDLEKTLLTVRPDAATCGGTMSMPQDPTKPINYPAMLNVSFDLMVAALKCDVTRVAAIQMVDAGGANLPWNFLPEIPEKGGGFHTRLRNWHDLGHNPVLGGTDHKRIADKWCMLQMAKLIERMKAIPEEGGTMLSNSVILWTNHMEDGQNHNCQKLPWILAGQAGGYFRTGQCALSAGKPISGVLADVSNAIGFPMVSWGPESYGKPWPGLRA